MYTVHGCKNMEVEIHTYSKKTASSDSIGSSIVPQSNSESNILTYYQTRIGRYLGALNPHVAQPINLLQVGSQLQLMSLLIEFQDNSCKISFKVIESMFIRSVFPHPSAISAEIGQRPRLIIVPVVRLYRIFEEPDAGVQVSIWMEN